MQANDYIGGKAAVNRIGAGTLQPISDPKSVTLVGPKPGWSAQQTLGNRYRAWGSIADNGTALPLGGVRINVYTPAGQIFGDTYISDGTGNWSMWVPSDTYIIKMTKDGFKDYTNPAYVVGLGYRLYMARTSPVQSEPQPMPSTQQPAVVNEAVPAPVQTATVVDNSAVYVPGVSDATPVSPNEPVQTQSVQPVQTMQTTQVQSPAVVETTQAPSVEQVQQFGYGWLVGAGALFLLGRSQKWW